MYKDLGLAAYPDTFKEVVISPTKLCLQFNEVEMKVRLLGNDGKQLPKDPLTHQPVAHISTGGKDGFGLLSVGCQMPVVFNLLKTVLLALEKYSQQHTNTFKKTYNKELKSEIKELKVMIDVILSQL